MDFRFNPNDNKEKPSNNFYGYNNGQYYLNNIPPQPDPAQNDYNKQKRKLTGLVIMFLALTLIINIGIGVYFVSTYKDAIATLEKDLSNKINNSIGKETHLPSDYSTPSLYVAQKNIMSVVEITASSNGKTSKGSGFIVNANGNIVTNAHVVRQKNGLIISNYSKILVNFYEKQNEVYELQVLYADDTLDLAILAFKSNKPSLLKPVTLMNSSYLRMGEDVVIIGNAQGYGLSLSKGVLSAEPYDFDGTEVLRTDAAINPGNSGGPMFNALGECIAVASFKIIVSEANEGLGFGITSNEVRDFLDLHNIKYISAN